MHRILPALLLLLVAAPHSQACGFIESAADILTLREEADASVIVLVGSVQNVRETPDGRTAELVVTQIIKANPAVKVGDVIGLPRFIPIPDPKNPPLFMAFCDIAKGKPEVYRGVPFTPALLEYYNGALKIGAKDRVGLMRYAFPYLEHADPTVRNDAYQTFLKSSDPDIRAVGRNLSADKLRAWLQAEGTTKDRRRLYAFLLASCGDKTDAALLRKLLNKWVAEDSPGLLDAVLTAYTLLDPKAGWAYTRDLVKDPTRNFDLRYAGLRAARYFKTTEPGVLTRDEILGVIAILVNQGDMADLPINNLREWRDWSLTGQILPLFGKEGFEYPIVRRAIVRYALQCPDPRAAKFIAELRKTHRKLVEDSEEWLKQEEKVNPPRPDILVADFEGDTYGDGWKTTGTAFGRGPARGTLPNQMPVSGFQGKGLVNSYLNGDASTGTLTSPEFKVERKYINFLVGGGAHQGKTCVNLLVGGKVVRTATGPNDRPGGSERLDWHTWDVAEFEGKPAVIQIVDEEKGGWGHINVDQITQSDTKKQAAPATRTLTVDQRYLHLPVENGAPMRRVKLLVGKDTVREFDIELDTEGKPDFWVFADVSAFTGKSLTVETMLPGDSKALDALKLAADIPDAEKLYREKHRPLFHFTSRRGWLNDPNGLVYHDGEWHLFYQHNPYGREWGNMHWGHAVSKDLFRWQELGEALYPRKYGDWAFSGSAVVDKGNTSGWGKDGKPPLVLAYTSTGRGECIAYSTDNGRTWTEYDKNPVVKHVGRDPKLVWYEKGKHWVMAVYDEFEKKQWIAFYTSPDLKTWTFASRIEGFFECPDLFESNRQGWVLYGADGKYLVGDFDGKEFRPWWKEKRQLWYGRFYAAQTFDNAPFDDNRFRGNFRTRRIQVGWANGVTFPGMPFNQQMTVPVDLFLLDDKDEARLYAEPVPELKSLREDKPAFELGGKQTRAVHEPMVLADDLDAFDADLLIDPGKSTGFTLDLRGTKLVYDAAKKTLTCKDVTAPVNSRLVDPKEGTVQLRIFVDRGSVEVFVNHGSAAMVVAAIPDEKNRKVELIPQGGEITIRGAAVYRMKSAWEK